MKKLRNGRNRKTTNRSKSKKTLLRSKLVKRTVNLLRTLGTLYRLKLTGR